MKPDFPRRGEIWLVNFNPGRGSEQKGVRPALVIQNDVGNQYASTTIVASVTATVKIYPVTVFLPTGKTCMKKNSMVNLAQIITIDRKRLIRRLGQLNASIMKEVDRALRTSVKV
jgi:mRNA interferase MazF